MTASTSTKTGPTTSRTRAPGRRPVTLHYFSRVDLSMSAVLGLEVRSLCGRWVCPDQHTGTGDGTATTRVCRTCQRSYDRIGRGQR